MDHVSYFMSLLALMSSNLQTEGSIKGTYLKWPREVDMTGLVLKS